MAELISTADGNLTGSTTFATTETGASALAMIRNNNTSISSATTVTSPSFTVTNAKVIDAVELWLNTSGTNGTGTFKVDLQKGGVSQASVTVNKSDLPDSNNSVPVPTLFKLTSTATGDGGSNWTIVITTTSGTGSATINISRNSGTANDWTRALRTTTTQAPAAADILNVLGELTGAGTHNTRTVTMDSTATTAYGNNTVNTTSVNGGGLRCSMYGILRYGTSASTNYNLRVNGDIEVFQNGELDLGTVGTEIPRTSTAALELQMVSATGDFGLIVRNNGKLRTQGLSRTSSKNVVKAKLTANVASSSLINSAQGSSQNNISWTSNVIAGPDGSSLVCPGVTENTTNATHYVRYQVGASIAGNTTVTAGVWLKRGSGTNNRYVRVQVADSTPTNGFYVDVDLQAGTLGTATALGNGSATSSSITAVGGGYYVKLTGVPSTGSSQPYLYLYACSALGTTSFAGSNTQAFGYMSAVIVTGSSISDTTYSVNTDTGWLSGDCVVNAATTRNSIVESGITLLNADAGASSFVSTMYPFGFDYNNGLIASTYHGTSPFQGEVALLTRNVKIRSTSTTLWGYVYFEQLADVDCKWTEFYYLGTSSQSTKRGIEIKDGTSGSTAARSITYCSMHDMNAAFYGNFAGSATSANFTFSNNVSFSTASAAVVVNGLTGSDYTIDSNIVIRAGGNAYTFSDGSGTITSNTAVNWSTGNYGYQLSFGNASIGTMSGNVAHSGQGSGWGVTGNGITGTITTPTAWRCNSFGINHAPTTYCPDLYYDSPNCYGNTTASLNWGGGDTLNITGSGSFSGDTTYSTTYDIFFGNTARCLVDVSNLDCSGTGTGLAPASTNVFFFNSSASGFTIQGTFNNCKFGSAALINSKGLWTKTCYLSFERYSQTAGDHRTEMKYGQIKTDTSIFHNVSPAMRLTPSDASNKLTSAPKGRGWLVPVNNGVPASVSVYVYKSKTGDGAAYNGNQPRLIQRANAALGQISDVVLATYSASTGSWNQLSGNTSTPTDDGAFEIIVDGDGTAGWLDVDDLQAA